MISRDLKDIIGGFALLVVGLVFLHGSLAYDFGTARQMGPGFYPGIVAGIVVALALFVISSGFARRTAARPVVSWRPLVFVTVAILVFAVAMRHLGLLPAIALCAAIASVGDARSRLATTTLTALALSVGAWLIFSVGLGLPLPLIRGVL